MKLAPTPTCPDCGAPIGQQHLHGCDIARCVVTGDQALQCMGEVDVEVLRAEGLDPTDYLTAQHPGTCDGDIWDGYWPGEQECYERGWFSKFVGGWVPCDKDDPDGGPDLNRLHRELSWDPQQRKYVD